MYINSNNTPVLCKHAMRNYYCRWPTKSIVCEIFICYKLFWFQYHVRLSWCVIGTLLTSSLRFSLLSSVVVRVNCLASVVLIPYIFHTQS